MKYEIRHLGTLVGSYELTPMPGCSAVGVSHGLFIDPEWRRKGIGSDAMLERFTKAKELGFQCLICTTKVESVAQYKILTKTGWKLVRQFTNPKTGNEVRFWLKHLTDPYLDISGIGIWYKKKKNFVNTVVLEKESFVGREKELARNVIRKSWRLPQKRV